MSKPIKVEIKSIDKWLLLVVTENGHTWNNTRKRKEWKILRLFSLNWKYELLLLPLLLEWARLFGKWYCTKLNFKRTDWLMGMQSHAVYENTHTNTRMAMQLILTATQTLRPTHFSTRCDLWRICIPDMIYTRDLYSGWDIGQCLSVVCVCLFIYVWCGVAVVVAHNFSWILSAGILNPISA